MEVRRYTRDDRDEWNLFLGTAKNASFLFHRDYMEYHADRFTDHSLVFTSNGRTVALLPANEADGGLVSHGGLTYGGMVTNDRMSATLMLDAFMVLRKHLADHNLQRLLYKVLPHIYHTAPAEEDLYALFRNDARLVRRDISSTVDMNNRLPLAKGRKSSLGVARRNAVVVKESSDFTAFMQMEQANLEAKFGVTPVHTAEEVARLAATFPSSIRLFTAAVDGELAAGVIVYANPTVAHTQYIASNERGRAVGATDAIIAHLLTDVYAGTRYFDFGISTESGGMVLNSGLIANKESYGGRATVHDFYELAAAG